MKNRLLLNFDTFTKFTRVIKSLIGIPYFFLPLKIARSLSKKKNKHLSIKERLLIDVSVLASSDAKTGIQRVVRAISYNISIHKTNKLKIAFIYADLNSEYKHLEFSVLNKNIYFRKTKHEVNPTSKDIFLGLDLCTNIIPRQARNLIKWKNKGVNFFFIIHDLFPLEHPEWFKLFNCEAFKVWLKAIFIITDEIICVSKTVEVKVLNYLKAKNVSGLNSIKLNLLNLSGDIGNSSPSQGIPEKNLDIIEFIRSRKTLLIVGTIEPRKGHSEVLQAVEKLWADCDLQINLMIIGAQGWMSEDISQKIRDSPEFCHRLLWLENISDEALTIYYTECSAVLIASYDEGFGLPVAEADYFGKQVIARDIPIFKELLNDSVIFFKSNSDNSLENVIIRWINEPIFEGKISSLKTKVSWNDSTNQILKITNECIF